MHTVFINTSPNAVGGRMDVLGIEKEFRKLTQIDVTLSSLMEEGFLSHAEKLGEMIDNYKEMGNDYNLVVYVDLLEMPEYVTLVQNCPDQVDKSAAYGMLRRLCVRFLVETIYETLVSIGRCPVERMLILMEQNRIGADDVGNNVIDDDGYTYLDKQKRDILLKMLGLPDLLEMARLAEKHPGAAFETAMTADASPRVAFIRNLYREKLGLLYRGVSADPDSGEYVLPNRASMDLTYAVDRIYRSDCAGKAVVSEFVTDRRGGRTNKEMSTKRNLLLQCLLLECVRTGSIYGAPEENSPELPGKKIVNPTSEQWNELFCMLLKKKQTYARFEGEAAALKDDYTSLGLAPAPRRFAHEKFGLDAAGNRSSQYVSKVIDPKAEEKADPNGKKDTAKMNDPVRMELETGDVASWFNEETYKPFDGGGDGYKADVYGSSAKDYIQRSDGLANHHLNFLRELSNHVELRMANYSGRSKNNLPPVLRKRSVMRLDDEDAVKNDYMYSESKAPSSEKTPVSFLERSSRRAYETVLCEYLKFSVGRDIAMTNIQEQCRWFVNRVQKIENSLKKLMAMLIVLAVALALFLVPYFMIQWEMINSSPQGPLIAALFVLVPFLLLGVGFGIARYFHLRKMEKLWKELVKLSDEVIEKNKAAVRAFDDLFVKHIPSLRWVYEYVLDVDFYRDCCRIADAKLSHHLGKLKEWRETVENILEDMECDRCDTTRPYTQEKIDYTKAYCEDGNREIYSIIDDEFLRKIYEN